MYASELMSEGYSPSDIIDSLVQNDANNNPTIRQYGVVDLIDDGRSAAYTGENCFDYKGHIIGSAYSIQGNILLGEEILINMENQFLSTDGSLSDKLMASLQGANIAGADTRCLDDGTSSLSAFIRVANPHDLDMTGDIDLDGDRDISDIIILIDFILAEYYDINGDMNFDMGLNILDIIILKNIVLDENYTGELYLDLNINNVDHGIEPIDLLQGLYDEWIEDNGQIDYNSEQ